MSVVDVQWSQPSLDLGPRPAVRVVLEVLVDPQDETGVVSVEATIYPERRLIALLSASPASWSDIEARVQEFSEKFIELLREHTAPFP